MRCKCGETFCKSTRAPEKGEMGMPAEKGHCLLLPEGFCLLLGHGQGRCRTALGTGPSLEVKVEEHQQRVLA